jgi:hypothetical protein
MSPSFREARLTSLDLHLRFPAATVVETVSLEDSACGIYPCYYRIVPGGLRVSSSAVALVLDAGGLELNPAFHPREYLQGDGVRQRFVHGTAALPKGVKDWAKCVLPASSLRSLSRNRFWYESWQTLDTRVHKLRPFGHVVPEKTADTFQPDFALRDPDELVARVADQLTRFVRDIEERYPEHRHVMMIGGKDSQILALIPKRRPDRWHVFSAAPNRAWVWQWLAWNDVETGQVFGHDNRNEETALETEMKIVCSDLYSDPRHLRWLPTLRRIAGSFDSNCFFWSGSAADALHVGRSFHRRHRRTHPCGFFDIHLTRVPCLVGNYHQVVKNFTGCPLLCPYQTADIWREVYRHHGPTVIPAGLDLRPRIGECVAKRAIRWVDANPGPDPYRYARKFNARDIYLRHIRDRLNGTPP